MVTKICKCCGKEFITEKNAQQHCSVKCRRKYNSKKKAFKKVLTCSWCGVSFEADRKRKYCSDKCRAIVNNRTKPKIIPKTTPKLSLEQIAKASREAGLSYGQYVMKMGL